MKKTITIKDIAKETGVHVSTVSRALSPNARASLSREVVERIRLKAKQMGYRPNLVASGLRTKRSMTVGIVIPDITNSLFPPIVRGVESVLEEAGYASILVNSDGDPKREERLLDLLLERGVDGIIDAAVTSQDEKVADISNQLPVVTANRMVFGSGIPAVVNDDAGGITAMFQLLVGKGHKEIAYIGGPERLSTGEVRNKAFIQTATRNNIQFNSRNIEYAKNYTEEEGLICAEKILNQNDGVTAILCANDRLALGALEAVNSRNLNCPEDISITGFNDTPMIDRIPPGLTTIRILQFDVGRIAAEFLLKKMNESGLPIPETTIMPVTIVNRGSVADLN